MFRWVANAGYAVFLVIVAVVPPTTAIAEFSVPDWLAHAAAYGIQAALLCWALLPVAGPRGALLGGFFGAITFGAVTEALQLLQPSRIVEVADLVANGVGALIACFLMAVYGRVTIRRIG